MALLERVIVPIATRDDAEKTTAALTPYLDEIGSLLVVHVIEKAGGGIDKAPMDKRQADAESMFDVVVERLGDRISVETEIVYGTDVVDALFETATDVDATALAFTAREGNRLTRLLSGDTSMRLVTGAELPVVALPE